MERTRRCVGASVGLLAAVVAKAAEPPAFTSHDDWATYGQGPAKLRYSSLTDVDTGNVQRLSPAWTHQNGILGTFPTNPLVVNGTMFLTTPYNHVFTLAVASAKLAWYHHLVPHDIWGYDSASPPLLIDAPDAHGRRVPALAAASKPGWR